MSKKQEIQSNGSFALIKNIFTDISFLYKNFFHWNISKILILLASFLVWMILSLPFFFLMIVLGFIDPIDWMSLWFEEHTFFSDVANYALIHPFYVLGWIFLCMLWGIFLFLWSSYAIVLESNLYLNYFKKNKLGFKDNIYFDKKKIVTYFWIFAWILFYLSLPLFAFSTLFLIAFLLFKVFTISITFLAILFALIAFICVVWFLYVAYRLSFAYLTFVDTENYFLPKKAKFYIDQSFALTKWKVFFKFLGIFALFSILLAPFNLINIELDENINDMRGYLSYQTGQRQIENIQDEYFYNFLKEEFSGMSNDEVFSKMQSTYVLQILYTLFFFLVIGGIFTMVLTSFYRRVLEIHTSEKKEKKEIKKSKKNKANKTEEKSKKKSKKNKDVKKTSKKKIAKKKKEEL